MHINYKVVVGALDQSRSRKSRKVALPRVAFATIILQTRNRFYLRQFLKPETFSPLFYPLFDTGRFIANHQFKRRPVPRGTRNYATEGHAPVLFLSVYSRTRQIYSSTESGYILVNAAKSHESATVSRKISRPLTGGEAATRRDGFLNWTTRHGGE